MGKHSNFLSKALKTIPYPKKGSDRRLGKDKLSQLEEELAQHKRQEQISSKQLADARAESALWQKKYEQLHAMVGRHVCEQPPPKDPQPPIPQRRSTIKPLSNHPPLPTTPEEDDHPSAPSPPAIAAIAAAAAAADHPAKSTHLPALTLTLPAPSGHHHQPPPHDDNNDSSPTTTSLSTTTTLCTPSSPSPSPPTPLIPSPSRNHHEKYTPSPRLATIPLLFALSALTRLAQREKPIHPTYPDAGTGTGTLHAGGGGGIVLKLLGANLILVAVLGEGARWLLLSPSSSSKAGRFCDGDGGDGDDGERERDGVGEGRRRLWAYVSAVFDEAWCVLLTAILAFALLLFEVRDLAFL